MCSPALHFLDPYTSAARGTALRSTLARTLETVHQLRTMPGVTGRPGFARIERLRDNMGYIELWSFERVDAACDAIATAMNDLANSEALVIDLRRNGGGDRRTAALLTSYLFDTEPVHLGERFASSHRFVEAPGARPAARVPARRYLHRDVYLIVGPATSELGREFAHNLERMRGATVIDDAA